MSKLKEILLFSFLVLIFGCSNDRLYEEFRSLPTNNWRMEDSLKFELGKLDTRGKAPLIGLRFNENYAFSNFYVKVIAKDSAGIILENKLINIPLFDSKTGEPLGKGFGSTYTKYDTLPFLLNPHTQQLILLQYMRQEPLKGIEAAGIKILK